MALCCIKENPAKYISFNCSIGKSYFTQRNNELTPSWACNTTSICIGLHLSGWSFPTGPYSQPEDNLTHFCWNNEQVLAYYEENYLRRRGYNSCANNASYGKHQKRNIQRLFSAVIAFTKMYQYDYRQKGKYQRGISKL